MQLKHSINGYLAIGIIATLGIFSTSVILHAISVTPITSETMAWDS